MNQYRFGELTLGLSASHSKRIDAATLDSFIELSGDDNPLHTDADYAKANGFEGRVVHGMLSSMMYSALVGVYLPGKYAILQCIDIRFSKPVYVDDSLKVEGKITYLNDAYKQIEIAASIVNQDQHVVSKAKIKVGLLDE